MYEIGEVLIIIIIILKYAYLFYIANIVFFINKRHLSIYTYTINNIFKTSVRY